MHLIYVLVIAVSLLTFLSALALVFGSSKTERWRSLWFLTAAIGDILWGVSIAGFLSLGTGEFDYAIAPWLIKGIYVGALVMDTAILGYVAWRSKFGKAVTMGFLSVAAALAIIFLCNPGVHYSTFILSNAGNIVKYDVGPWFIAYTLFFCAIVPAFCLYLFYRIKNTTSKNLKKGYLFFMIGLMIAGGMSLVFDLIMPIWRYDMIWVGPMLIGLVMLGFYYAVLKYRMISLSTGWLKVMSSIVIIGSAIIVYLFIFRMIFSALFRVTNPSFQVILLNFIMIAIALALGPAISEMLAMTRSLIMTKQIDIAYIVKQLSRLDRRRLNYKDISGFLAEHMHFAYIGFLVKGRYYSEDTEGLPTDTLAALESLEVPARGIWASLKPINAGILKENGIYKVAIITDTNGETIGQIIFGKPTDKMVMDRKNTAEVEMVVGLIGTMIENGGRKS